jgi:hypothetical protein
MTLQELAEQDEVGGQGARRWQGRSRPPPPEILVSAGPRSAPMLV